MACGQYASKIWLGRGFCTRFLGRVDCSSLEPQGLGYDHYCFYQLCGHGRWRLLGYFFSIAVVLLLCQTILRPLWAGAGQFIARNIQGTAAERGVYIALACLTVVTVFYALFGLGFET